VKIEETTPKLLKNSDLLLAAAVLGVLGTLIVPLPTPLLDAALVMNLGAGVLILLLTLSCKKPLDFSTFPSLLLFTTLSRLALNVASTRLVLLDGDAGQVIEAFGRFVVGGDLFVGLVVFLILVVVQFMVISKGAGRISEVAARFTLDAMPGKQMAIDAELNAHHIDEKEAKRRRDVVTSEAEFYGAMDGAGKFVRGDAVAGLIITGINLVGGIGVGMAKDLTAMEAIRKYAVLTVGDGLVAQIPALLISIASGFLVTKQRGKHQLSRELASQFMIAPKAARLSAGIVAALGLVPGLPLLPFVLMSGALFGVAWYAGKTKGFVERDALNDDPEPEAAPSAATAGATTVTTGEAPRTDATPEALNDLLKTDRLGLSVGYRLVPMVNASARGGLVDRIAGMRRQFAAQFGFVVPSVHLRDNLTLEPNGYRILLGGQEIARGLLYPDHWLAMSPGDDGEMPAGVKVKDPTFGLPAVWVPSSRKADAEAMGCTVVDAESVLVTHLTETIKEHAHELLSRDDVQKLLERVKEAAPVVVGEINPDQIPLGLVQGVLQNLLRERVPVRNLPAILEAVADYAKKTKEPDQLAELVRQRVARTIVELHATPDGVLATLTLDPRYEQDLNDALTNPTADPRAAAALSPQKLRALQEAAVEAWRKAQTKGKDPVVLVRSSVRRYMADLLRGVTPRLPVLSFHEATFARSVDAAGVISLEEPAPRPAAPTTPSVRGAFAAAAA
jgi:flagellar biosynthesis protein FlhA